MNKLTTEKLSVSVPGKLILIGEHSVVFGHTAIAMPLSDIRLTLETEPVFYKNWTDVWNIKVLETTLQLTEHFISLLVKSLELSLFLFGFDIKNFTPQSININSEIPLGGGMGGSAAVASSLIRLCSKIFNRPLDIATQIDYANKIDSLFHSGRASGLDVAAILTEQLIKYNKKDSFKIIQSKCSYYIALIDTEERSETSKMINIVSKLLSSKDNKALKALKNLSKFANKCVNYLEQGYLEKFANNLNAAQTCLQDLHVSTPKIEIICQELKKYGALCAKLTGAGGGGLVLGIFKNHPSFLKDIYRGKRVFITQCEIT